MIKHSDTKVRTCECGEATGEPCSGVVDTDESNRGVTVYWMPEYLRESHRACHNSGVYPHNGELKLYVHPACAEMLAESDDAESDDAESDDAAD